MAKSRNVRSEETIESLALKVCEDLGLEFDAALFVRSGKIKRFREVGKQSRDRPGWLHLFADGQGGIAGNWKTGARLPFFLSNWTHGSISEEERTNRKNAIRRAQTAAEKYRREEADKAALRAETIWRRCKPLSSDHPYLLRKGIMADAGLRLFGFGNVIVAPLRNAAGELRSLQLISANGTKRFLSGGELSGNHWSIGVPEPQDDLQTVLVCEGISTAKTLHAATGLPIISALSCHNLAAVAKACRQVQPAARIIICGDDDWQTERPVKNPGLKGAKEAADAVSGISAVPSFKGIERGAGDTDFNDMAQRCGLTAVSEFFHSLLETTASHPPEMRAKTMEDDAGPDDDLDGEVGCYCSSDGKINLIGDEELRLANFAAKITGEIVIDDGVETTKRLEIAWRFRHRRGVFEIPARQFSALHWPMDEICAGAVVAPGTTRRDHLRAAIQYLSGEIPPRHIYAQTGWRKHEGSWVYIHNNGAIGSDSVSTELLNGLKNFALPSPPTGSQLMEALRASLKLLDVAPDRVSCPLFSAIYRAPLQRSDFSLVFVGQSGSGKSSIAALAQAHFGAAMADRNGLPADWSSTPYALEFMAFQASDAMLVIDEGEAAHGSPTARAELENKISRILRAVGNQATRSRMTSDGRPLPDKPPRALVVATKEEGLSGYSLVSRTLTLTIAPGEAAGGRGVSGLGPWQDHAQSGVYAQALSGYVNWLSADLEGYKSWYLDRFETAREKLADRLSHPRTADIIAQLVAASRLFLRFACEAGAISKLEATEAHRRILNGLINAASEQVLAQVASDPVETFFNLLRSLLASGRAHMRDTKGDKPLNPSHYGWRRDDFGYQPQGDHIGWIAEDGGLYLLMDVAFSACQRLARESGQILEVGPTALRKRIDNKGLILTKEGGAKKRLTNRVLIDGAKVTVLHVTNPLTSEDEEGQDREVADESEGGAGPNRTIRTLLDRTPALSEIESGT